MSQTTDRSTRQRVRYGVLVVSFLLFPVTMYYFSPALIIQGAAAGIVVGSFLMFVTQFVASLFLGRAFCGWACPAGGIQEACFPARDRRLSGRGDWIKYAIWVPWLGGIAAAAVAAGGFREVDPFFQTTAGISIAEPWAYIVYYGFLALIVGLALGLGRRAFCHHVCWMAPFMIVGRRIRNQAAWPSLRLSSDGDVCVQCGTCTQGCPMSLPVQEMVARGRMERVECILCGTCTDGCPESVIEFSFSGGTASVPRSAQSDTEEGR